jgi:hypothetical protein
MISESKELLQKNENNRRILSSSNIAEFVGPNDTNSQSKLKRDVSKGKFNAHYSVKRQSRAKIKSKIFNKINVGEIQRRKIRMKQSSRKIQPSQNCFTPNK